MGGSRYREERGRRENGRAGAAGNVELTSRARAPPHGAAARPPVSAAASSESRAGRSGPRGLMPAGRAPPP